MATFAKSTFNTAIYALTRPTYPPQLFDFIFKYHERTAAARWQTAIDLGCGTGTMLLKVLLLVVQLAQEMKKLPQIVGQATVDLTKFKRVIGVDPSNQMLHAAREYTTSLGVVNCEYVQSNAEDLDFLPVESVDMITAG